MRTLAPFSSYGASRTETKSPRSVASFFRPGTRRTKILGPSQGHQPAGEVVHHLFFGRSRARGDLSQSTRDLQQVLHSVAHLARKQLVGFLSLLALRDVKEDAEHKTIRYVSVVALPPSGYPADVAP